jgi:hypothetical protein
MFAIIGRKMKAAVETTPKEHTRSYRTSLFVDKLFAAKRKAF